ncbi:MAG: hypothetical protein EOM16_08830, partial [Bacteroidia bacterium]|nr:hypothetical protein [Bacteroidia bacterium]
MPGSNPMVNAQDLINRFGSTEQKEIFNKIEQARQNAINKRNQQNKPRPRPTYTTETAIQRQLAQARTPQEKANLLEQQKRLRDLQRTRQQTQQTQETEQPTEQIQLVSPLPPPLTKIDQTYLDKTSQEIEAAKQFLANAPPGTKITIGDKELTPEEAIQELDKYQDQIVQLNLKLQKEGNLHVDIYQDPETKEYVTVIVSNRERKELLDWGISYKRAEKTWNDMDNPLTGLPFMLEKLVDPNDPIAIRTITTALEGIASGKTSEETRQKVIDVIAQSYYMQYSAKRQGFKGIVSYTLQMPIVQYGLAISLGTIVGAGIGALSTVAPKLGTVTKIGMGVTTTTLAGSDIYKSYKEEGLPGATTSATRLGIGVLGGYQGYKLGYPVGERFGLSRRAIQYNPTTNKISAGIQLGNKQYYWKSVEATPEQLATFKSQFEPYNPPKTNLLTGKSISPIAQSTFSKSTSISYGMDTNWQPQTGTYFENEFPLSTKVLPKMTRWIPPGKPVQYGKYNLPYEPLFSYPTTLESGGKVNLFELKSYKPIVFKATKDIIKPDTAPSTPFTTQGQ